MRLAIGMLAVLLARAVEGQSLLRGVVSDTTGRPLPGAVVEIDQLKRSATTDPQGAFLFGEIPEGKYRVRARSVGYRPHAVDIRIERGKPASLALQLAALPVLLDSLAVEAPAPEAYNPLMRGFGERRRVNPGHFMGPEELESSQQTDLAGVLRKFQVPIRYARGNRPYAAARAGRSASYRDACPVQVFLDGQLYSNDLGVFDVSSVRVENLAGIEYYESLARIPLEFQRGDWACGVLVLWTRMRKPD